MNILGYFPGVDFDSSDQFGRRVHVKELVDNFDEIDECSAWFMIGAPAGRFEGMSNVREAGYSDSPFGRMLYELYRCVFLLWFVRSHDIDLIYTRDSPYFAPAVVNSLTGVHLVVEANGVPESREATLQRIRKRAFNWLRRTKRTRASKIIAVSDGIRNHLLGEDPTYRIDVIENGVDVERFNICSPVSTTPPYTICYVGGLQRWQGIETMIEVVGNLESDAELIIVGGTQERRSEIGRFVRKQGLQSRVELVGRVPHKKVSSHINQADLCFGPFVRTRNASPMKIYEYVSCGREVVYANKNGLDRIESIPGVHRLNHCSDINALAEQVDQIISTIDTNHSGRLYITEHHSWKLVVRSLFEASTEIIDNN